MSDSAEMPPPSEVPMTKQEQVVIEKQQENLLKQKYPQAARGRPAMGGAPPSSGGHSAFLQKRLAKGQKYFDSGDYQMAKQKSRGAPGARLAMPVLAQPTGDTIPTPELVPARKTSIIQPFHDHTQSMHVAADPNHPTEPGRPLPNPAIAKLTS